MKKLFALLLMLTVSIGSWAYNKDWSQETGDRYYNLNIKADQSPAYEQFIISGAVGEFARWCNKQIEDLGFLKNTSKTVLHVQGPINADDVTAICSNLLSIEVNGQKNFLILDFSKATSVENTAFFNSTTPRWQSNQMIIFPNAAPPTIQQVGSVTNSYQYDIAYFDNQSTDLLYVYVRDWSDGLTNFENLSLILNESNGIYFLPFYHPTGEFNYYQNMVSGKLFDKLASVPVASYDFTMCNASTMPTDFSGTVLSPKTHFLTLPVTDKKYDITAENIPYENNKAYIYNDNIYVVSTFKSNESPYAKFCGFKNKSYTVQEPTNFTYVRQVGEGRLGEAANFISNDQRTSSCQVFAGYLNGTDVSKMEMMHATKFDFSNATISETNMLSFKNNNVKYLALPDNQNGNIKGTINNCSFYQASNPKNCPALLCVGAYNTTSNTLTTWSKQEGEVSTLTSMIRPIPDAANRKDKTTCVGLNNVVMSGYLNFDDISTAVGLNAAVMKSADLSNACFLNNNNMNFAAAGWSYSNNSAHTIILPTDDRMISIPAGCMNTFKDLKSICIPSNYKNIGAQVFDGANQLSHITTTDANGKLIDNGEGTYTLSANLAYDATTGNGTIGTAAFNTGVHEIHDIYVLATTAPKCDVDAFSSGMTFGWGGFAGNQKHPVCRDNYDNQGFLFTILHFPANATDPAHYTDITRKYTLMDETGATDGKGDPLYWPLQEEFIQSYNQAMWGVTWDDNTHTYSVGKETTLHTNDGTGTNTYNTEYAGWHQFVLSNYGYSAPTPLATEYFEDDYYTLCFPFDMSRDEVLSILGVNYNKIVATNPTENGTPVTVKVDGTAVTADQFPKVYTLKGVTRIGSMITLEFCQDLMALAETESKTIKIDATAKDGYTFEALKTRNREGADRKTVYIKGGYPYLVKPILPKDTPIPSGLAKYIMSKHKYTKAELGNTKSIGTTTEYFAAPVDNHKVIATDGTNKLYNGSTPYYYYFQGTYTQMPLPKYAYFLGKRSGETKKFFRYSSSTPRNWTAYSSIIGGKCPANAFIITEGTEGDEIDSNATYEMTVDNDDFESAGIKYQFTIEGEDGFDEAVNIEKIDGEIVNAAALEGDVFNVAGQRVGTSVEGLSKGLYIVNGKKVLVK